MAQWGFRLVLVQTRWGCSELRNVHVVNGCFYTGVQALLVAKLARCLGNPSACLGRVPSAARQKQANSEKKTDSCRRAFLQQGSQAGNTDIESARLSRRLLRSLEGTHSKGNCIHSQGTNEFPGDCWNSENITDVDGTAFQKNAGKTGWKDALWIKAHRFLHYLPAHLPAFFSILSETHFPSAFHC